jgi:hypothetical protein
MAKQKLTFPPPVAYEKDIIEPMPSQHHRVLEEDSQDTLVAWQLEREVQILVVILLIAIITVIGFLNRRIENVLLFALFLSGIIIALVFFLLGSS